MHDATFTVEPEHTVTLQGLPPVLATPWLVWHLEMSALKLLEPYLDVGHISVGSQIELEHLAPATVGAVVTCRARVIHVDGAAVNFQIEATDSFETLSRGVHRRHIVEAARLARRIAKKSSSG
ncbi:MAG: thioesterase family protein [Planctomycetaceae bacterium]|nr:thioesterase family protein [Planctomycetaceae bacterium]